MSQTNAPYETLVNSNTYYDIYVKIQIFVDFCYVKLHNIREVIIMKTKTLALSRLNRQIAIQSDIPQVEDGWIKEVRRALGMTLDKLGEICGLAPSTVSQAEKRELEGKVTVETLRKAAEAMNCEFVYTFIPKSDLNTFIEKAAYEKAKRILMRADLHMSLEDQQVKSEIEPRIQRLKHKLISEGKVW